MIGCRDIRRLHRRRSREDTSRAYIYTEKRKRIKIKNKKEIREQGSTGRGQWKGKKRGEKTDLGEAGGRKKQALFSLFPSSLTQSSIDLVTSHFLSLILRAHLFSTTTSTATANRRWDVATVTATATAARRTETPHFLRAPPFLWSWMSTAQGNPTPTLEILEQAAILLHFHLLSQLGARATAASLPLFWRKSP